jgi:transcriptional/translational regulatory protein YebC/TACO1
VDFPMLQEAFDKAGLTPEVGEISWIPENTIGVEGEDAEKVLRLVERLEDLDDVQNVYANFDISEEEMQRLNA